METSLLSLQPVLGDLVSLGQPLTTAEEGSGLLDDCLEMARSLSKSPGFPRDEVRVSSDWLAVDDLLGPTDYSHEDAFSGLDWMAEKIDLNMFDFDSLIGMDSEGDSASPDELMAALEDPCSFLGDLSVQTPTLLESQTDDPIKIPIFPGPITGEDQLAPLSPDLLLATSDEPKTCTPDHSFSLDLGSEVDITENEKKADLPPSPFHCLPKEEDEAVSDDSGIGMSPRSEESQEDGYLPLEGSLSPDPASPLSDDSGSLSPVRSPATTVRVKPYDRPAEKAAVQAKVKAADPRGGGTKPLEKKLKKMEQNKTAATRYRQKKRAEQEALLGECSVLEDQNKALTDKAESLAKEIQYLKDLLEEVRKAKSKKPRSPQ
ncbi:cyclic AMP-dependent transcription factor ATF-4 [Latimeria chalumnae]|uniref:Cyclic AMP-dependent transcription factor ATF-4 n=1 Tax=Latimeria chalumnae TaxID=7897 RepID=H3A462_LATCH|nr:PREDICTED: cyclic AMP-dependent transcription factor ATF-4 [Latimeria chalumnae]|eukprot:XP_006006935.1 PREDICTED: cyclic AMP-dependent transcription factor ATF-4 [Latimeria chalumnae]